MSKRSPKRVLNFVGNRYGKLTVIKCTIPSIELVSSAGKWLCKCDCGNEKEITGLTLIRNKDKGNCGCEKNIDYKNYMGVKTERLLVIKCIEPAAYNNNGGLWLCQCSCGNTIQLSGYRTNHTKSCGCLHKVANENRRQINTCTYNAQYDVHRTTGRKREGGVYLDKDIWLSLVKQPCFYCGGFDLRNEMSNNSRSYNATKEIIKLYEVPCNGIDRIDSSKGYEVDNCVPCCKVCNVMKMAEPQESFLNKIYQINSYSLYNRSSVEEFLCN